ncbi:hypothetical protein KGF54_002802 [Candida jiufengensis]|uniref:uncharacterized protein n=1 Tax=Candida jiufengensis TaxID=497108 RepID=UPI002224A30A|nr:uncharacterized protein KGF54_002802 [Candida jiufengensis]KAI5953430.1 hypothetical protein KGF54_002802 [Candida jiufengensis]
MVTAEQLKKLNNINNKKDENNSLTNSKKIEPYSIDWLINEEQQNYDSNEDELNMIEVGLRNKRLQLLFPLVYPKDDDDDKNATNNSNFQNYTTNQEMDNMNETSSINFPTTRLKPHELTNELEIQLLESSMFHNSNNDNNLSNRLEFDSFSLGNISSDLTRSKSSKEEKYNSITGDESLKSSGQSNNSLRKMKRPTSIINISPQKRILNQSKFNNQQNIQPPPIVKESTTKTSYVEYLKPKPLKRFRSRSSCDLVFPNLNIKRQSR